MASRLWRKQFLDRKPFPSWEKDMPEMIQKVIKEVLGSVFKNKGENDEWWYMMKDEWRWQMTNEWRWQLSKPPTFRFKTSLTNVSMVWLNRVGASNNNEETERITILCGIWSQDSGHFFWCRKKHPHQIHVTWYVTCIIHFCIIISQMVASTRRFWCQLNYFFWNFHPEPWGNSLQHDEHMFQKRLGVNQSVL